MYLWDGIRQDLMNIVNTYGWQNKSQQILASHKQIRRRRIGRGGGGET